jgi:hypothetical protein
MVCSAKCAYEYQKKQKEKAWRKEKKERKEKLKTKSDWMKEAQYEFNKYIRLRDKDKDCISCGVELKGKYDAGHYYPAGSYPNLRFNPNNVHGQCVHCNQHKHGNLQEYREGLIKRIGEKKLKELDELRNGSNKYTIEDLKLIKADAKIKQKWYE